MSWQIAIDEPKSLMLAGLAAIERFPAIAA
jgi:hypothetical protein